jgi:hypothetical protein
LFSNIGNPAYLSGFLFRLRGFGFFFRCCGGLFATTFTARSKRCHASGSSSIFDLDVLFFIQATYV